YTNGNIVVTYVYEKVMGTVIAHYVDTKGNTLADDVTTTGQINVDTYATTQKTIANWTFANMLSGSAATSGTYTNGTLEVTYIYDKTLGTVVVEHVYYNLLGEKIVIFTEDIITAQTGTSYSTSPLDTTLEAYARFKLDDTKLPVNATGSIVEGETIVTYVYLKYSTVTIQYLDDKYDPLREEIVYYESIGTAYTSEEFVFEGYDILISPENPTGIHEEEDIVVTYVYGAIGGPEVPTGAFTNYLVEIIFMISLLAMAGLIIFKKKIMM
ncbi:MAG TPA: MucBP domain-containing protein, partial [Bacilli bacterium]|nr:MucBP domain-containing protein [Bacilli bacterium]